VLCVVGKQYTPVKGATFRSLSHHLALYHLGEIEAIWVELERRRVLHFVTVHATTWSVLICEDLARQDPAADLIRAVQFPSQSGVIIWQPLRSLFVPEPQVLKNRVTSLRRLIRRIMSPRRKCLKLQKKLVPRLSVW
jgi:hypothetical protein